MVGFEDEDDDNEHEASDSEGLRYRQKSLQTHSLFTHAFKVRPIFGFVILMHKTCRLNSYTVSIIVLEVPSVL